MAEEVCLIKFKIFASNKILAKVHRYIARMNSEVIKIKKHSIYKRDDWAFSAGWESTENKI